MQQSTTAISRPQVQGKFLFVGEEKLYLRGVTYGTFRPDGCGAEFHDPAKVGRDFAQMREAGVNTVRTYTVPPLWLLDLAQLQGLRVMVGLAWEQHVTFLDEPVRARAIVEQIRAGVRACAGHPALLCYVIGNEIPSLIVRWHGARAVERFLLRLYRVAKAEDPQGLVTYVNYPSTEYLQLPYIDFLCFNVYLEQRERLDAYLARLHNLAGDRPLVLAELGLCSRRHGEEAQAHALGWQLCSAFAGGCAGAVVFSWTDEWHRGGQDIEDWDFGLTTRARRQKPALLAVRRAFAEIPFPSGLPWPRVSVVVCSYNGGRTIRDCCEGLLRLDYPHLEVIVVNDGSTDDTAAIVQEYGFRLISTENRGLSAARNTGLAAATGEIVAYTDDDARPDPHWLRYLAATFLRTQHAGVGGPNIAPPGDGPIADCVANAPGGPVHVLLSDELAEHIPGCNMAFRKACLTEIGGFDPRFRAAGDDVDVCWQLQARGHTLGFSPAAMVWHHRRSSVRTYWMQQKGYGKAEALLEQKWPERYNALGHIAWAGRLYGKGLTEALPLRPGRIYQGTWGAAPFQSLYGPTPGLLQSLLLMPEWYLLVAGLAVLSVVSLLWPPLRICLPLLAAALAAPVAQAVRSAVLASFTTQPRSPAEALRQRALTALLHLLQPLARLIGRLRHGLTPWRQRGVGAPAEVPMNVSMWSERWQDPVERAAAIERAVRRGGAVVRRGGDFDPWDLEVRGGLLGGARARVAVEEHGAGRQLVRVRSWPRLSTPAVVLWALLWVLAAGAVRDGAWAAAALLGGLGGFLLVRMLRECDAAAAALLRGLGQKETGGAADPAQSGDRGAP